MSQTHAQTLCLPHVSTPFADFAVLSYYKLFGHPTGLGALVARKPALRLLAAGRAFYGGGTVELTLPGSNTFIRSAPQPQGVPRG